MRIKTQLLVICLISIFLITSCGSMNSSKTSSDYEMTKTDYTDYRYVENADYYERISFENNPQRLLPESSIYYTIVEGERKQDNAVASLEQLLPEANFKKLKKAISEKERTYSDYKYYNCYHVDEKEFSIRINQSSFSLLKKVYPIFTYGNTILEKERRLLHLFNATSVEFDNLYKILDLYFGEITPSAIRADAFEAQNSGFLREQNNLLMTLKFKPISYRYRYDIKTHSITPTLCLSTLGKDWLHINRITFSIDEKIWEIPIAIRLYDNSSDFVWEYTYLEIEDKVMEVVRALANSDGKNIIIRFSGNQYHKDYTGNIREVEQAKKALKYLEYFEQSMCDE